MSINNGVIRIGRKGVKKFAFGEDGPAFEIDVVAAFQQWIGIDNGFRPEETAENIDRSIATADMPGYHQAAVEFIAELGGGEVTIAEALDFIARLREQYDDLAHFFRPKSREERELPATSVAGLRFSVEGS